jgi:uncharacterized repeat protein (TIGR01451 family)
MTRGIPSHPVLAAILALALLVSISAPVGAAPYATAGAGASTEPVAALAALDGPGHHFGFGQASVLAQTTPQQTQTAVAAQQTQVAAPTPTVSGTPGTTGACTNEVGGTCTIQGDVSGSWTKTGSGTLTVVVATPAGAVLNDGVPILFVPTTIGVEQFNAACGVPIVVGGLVTCTATTVGDLLVGGTVTVRFVGVQGPIDRTGTILAGPGAGLVRITKTDLPDPTVAGAQLTYTITVTNTAGFTVNGITVTDTLPANTTFVSATSTAGTCTGTTTITCNIGDLAAGATVTITIIVVPTPLACGTTLSNTATVNGRIRGVAFTASDTATTQVNCPPLAVPNLPILPPPPLEFIPPPPPPLLPPPPPAPTGAAPRMAPFPEVPVIPEADSLFLLVGGLVALGGLVAYRRLRRRDD